MPTSLRDVFTPLIATVLLIQRTPTAQATSAEALRARFNRLIDEAKELVRREDLSFDSYQSASFAVIAWLDERVLDFSFDSNRELFEQWKRAPLQAAVFSTANAGEEFFIKLDGLGPTQRDIREVYHLCLSLGFRGQYYDSSQEHKLVDIRRKQAQLLPFKFSDLIELAKSGEHLSPPVYEVAPPTPPAPASRPVPIAWIAVPAAFVLALVAYFLWPEPVPPPPPPPAARTAEEILADVRERLAGLACASVSPVDFRAGRLTLEGTVSSDTQRQEVPELLRSIPEVSEVSATLKVLGRPFCEVIELLTPIQKRGKEAGVELTLRPNHGCEGSYARGDTLVVEISAQNRLQYVCVYYFVGGRTAVAHMLPNAKNQNAAVDGVRRLTLGQSPNDARWVIEPPFGTEMLSVLVTSKPLFSPPRVAPEDADGYVDALRKALDEVGRDGAIAASYCFISTAEG